MRRYSMFSIQYLTKKILTLFLLIVLWCIFLWSAFAADHSFALNMDNEFFIGTVLSSMSASLRNGEWPLHMSTILGGMPLYNFAQMSPFYPFYFVVLSIFNSPLEVIHSMHWITLGHILILEINTYIFLRVVGVSRLSAFTGAALFAFSANSFSYAVWMNMVAPYSWLPLYLAGLVGILKSPQSMPYAGMTLVGIVLLTLASPAQPLIHAIFVTLVFLFVNWRKQLRINQTKQFYQALCCILVIGILALLLTAPVILPVTLEFKNMIRWIGAFPAVTGNARIPFDAFQTDQLSFVDLAGVFFKFKSAAVGSQFAGVLVIALAFVAFVSRPRSWMITALGFIGLYSLMSSAGSNLGFAYLNYIIPILNKIREPSRFLVLFQFAVCSLAALGFDELRKTILLAEDRADLRFQFIAMLITLLIASSSLFFLHDRIVSNVPPLVSLVILFALISITYFATRFSIRNIRAFVEAAWVCSLLIFLAIEVPWIPPPISYSQYLTSKVLSLDKAIERISILDPNHEYRVIFDGKIDKKQAAMLASYRGVRTFNAYFNPAPKRQFEEIYYFGPRSDNYFKILGAKYLICDECSEEAIKGYKLLENFSGYAIYETDNVLPRSYIVNRLDGEFSDLANFLAKASNADLTKNILFTEPNKLLSFSEAADVNDKCFSGEDIHFANRIRFLIQCKSAGVLVLNQFFDDDWKTSIDGFNTETLRINGNQMGVAFAPGSHLIEFRYLPTIFIVSLVLMFVGMFVLVLLIWSRVVKSGV